MWEMDKISKDIYFLGMQRTSFIFSSNCTRKESAVVLYFVQSSTSGCLKSWVFNFV